MGLGIARPTIGSRPLLSSLKMHKVPRIATAFRLRQKHGRFSSFVFRLANLDQRDDLLYEIQYLVSTAAHGSACGFPRSASQAAIRSRSRFARAGFAPAVLTATS